MSGVQGHAEPGWEAVADVFAANFAEGRELGSACCVYADGEPVVDLWGGRADDERPWREDTVVLAFSTTKGATAICAHMLVERGLLDLDAPVTDYWPEYGAAGKEGTLVRWLLSHRAGVPALDAELTLEEVCAWEPAIRAIEAQPPFWAPGEEYLYHAVSYGFLVGEVVRRIAGTSLGAFFADEVAGPLGLSTWIGTPAEVEPRVARLVLDPPAEDPEGLLLEALARAGIEAEAAPVVFELMRAYWGEPLLARSVDLGGAFADGLLTYNLRSVREAELPGANLVTDARSLARMYAAAVGEVDGVRLLRPETVAAACVPQTDGTRLYNEPAGLAEFAELFEMRFGLGFLLPMRSTPLLGPRSFGHGGAGGSLGCADPVSGVGFGYVMNRLTTDGSDRRAAGLAEAVRGCLG